jgi:hypothetical protein
MDRKGFWGTSVTVKDGQLDLSTITSMLEQFQSDGIDYLYDIEPQSNNLFYAGFFQESITSEGKNTQAVRPFYNAQYRIRKVTLPFPKLEVEMHPILRTPLIQKATYDQEVTIDWFEDVYHSVQQYHLDWIARWYNRKFDVLRCGTSGKFKELIVVAFHYINDADGPVLIETPKVQPIMAFRLAGLVPEGLPELNFDYNADANDQNLSIKYKCGVIDWLYGTEIGLGYNVSGAGNGQFSGINANRFDYGAGGRVWAPHGIMEPTEEPGSTESLEQKRVVRSATTSLE